MKRLMLILFLFLSGVFSAAAQEATPEPDPQAAAEALADENGQFVRVNDYAIYYVTAGPEDGPPVLLLHGFLGSSLDFYNTIPALAEAGYRVIAFDRPPFGLSTKNTSLSYTLKAMSELTAAFMDELGIEQAALVGHSAGGSVVADFVVRYPERVSKFVLIAGAVGISGPFASPDGSDPTGGFGAMIAQMDPDSQQAQSMIEGFFTSPMFTAVMGEVAADPEALNLPPEILAIKQRWQQIPGWAGGLLAFVRDSVSEDSQFDLEQLKAVEIPALLIWGEADAIVPISLGETLRDLLPNDTWVTYPDTGHSPMDEATDQMNADLLEFLASDLP
jgi:pimeloyl-ACP methyl ester carboxylesterase